MRRARVRKTTQGERKRRGGFNNQGHLVEPSIPIGAFRTTPQGKVVSANTAFVKMMGYSSQKAMLDADASEHYMEEEKRSKLLQALGKKGEVTGFEALLRRKKGPPIWVSMSVKGISDFKGRLQYLDGIAEDITNRKETEEALKTERDRAQNYLDIAGVIMLVIDSRGIVTMINQKGVEVLGFREKEIVGKKWFDTFVPRRMRSQVKQVFRKIIKGEVEPFEYYENPVVTKKGDERIIAWHNTILRDAKGNVTASLSSGLDITERKIAEDKERAYNRNLSFLSRTAMDFVAFDEKKDIFEYIASKLMALVENAVLIAVTSYDEIQDKFTVRQLSSHKRNLKIISDIMGKNPKGMSFYMREKEKMILRDPKIFVLSKSLEKITRGNLLDETLGRIRKLTGLGDMCVMGFNRSGKFYGSAVAILKTGARLENQEIVEAFINQAAVALQRKRAEEALREGERFLSSVFSSIQDGVSVLDEKLNIIRVNPTMEKWFSRALPLTGKNCHEAYHSRDIPCEVCPTLRTLKKGKTATGIIPKRGSNGEIVGWFDLYSFPLVDLTTGKTRGVIEYIRDISDRKQAEEALKESEEKYRSLVENMRKGLLVYDWEKDTTVYANKTVEEIFGFPVEASTRNTKKGLSELLTGITVEGERNELADTLKTAAELRRNGYSETMDFEMRIMRGDGRISWLHARTYPVQSNSTLSYIILEDISERKRAEETLKESEEKYSELFHHSNDAIFIHDPEGNIVDVNQKALDLFGFSRQEIMRLKIRDLHPEKEFEQSKMAFETVTTQGHVKFEIEFKKKNGLCFPAEVSSSMFEIGGRKVIQGIVRDITERKRFEEKLIRSSKLASLGVLAGGIAHQINNPLATMLFASSSLRDLLAKKDDFTDQARTKSMEYIDTLERQIERAHRVTSGLLAFAQTRRVQIKPTSITEVIEKAVEFLAGQLTLDDIDIEISIEPDLPDALVDPVALEEVIINLAQNSFEAMKWKGKITIRGTGDSANMIRIKVSDNGPGISEEIKREIFDPLFTTKEFDKGTGLGLSVTAMLLERLDGRIWFEDTPGGGATFVVEIPSVNHQKAEKV